MKILINILKGLSSILSIKSKVSFLVIILLSFLSITTATLTPVIMSKLTDKLNESTTLSDQNLGVIVWLGLGYVILISLTKSVNFISLYMQSMLRVNCLSSVSHYYLKDIYYKNKIKKNGENTGSMAQRLNNINNDLYSLINNFVFNIIPPVLQIFFSLTIIVFTGDFIVASLFLIYIISFMVFNHKFTKKIIKARTDLMDSGIRAYALLTDSVKNISAARSCNSFDFYFKRYNDYLSKDVIIQKKYWKKNSLLIGFSSLINVLFFSFTFIFTLLRVINGEVSLGHFVMISSYIFLLSSPLDNIGSMLSQIKQSTISLGPFFDGMKNSGKISYKDFSTVRTAVSLDIVNLSHSYEDNLILNEVTLSILPGKFVTVTGRSGSGKTTLVNLITLNLPPDANKIFIDGIDVKEISPDILNELQYYVTQDDNIFMDSVEFNLRIANPNATRNQLLEAIELSNLSSEFSMINDDILSLKLGDNGETLSGGQRQRLSLARLFLRSPKLIILDEITSSLDLENERKLMNNIRKKFPLSTIINISHRESTFKYSDIVMKIENGFLIHGKETN
ncbi:ATP-binding cassette domain-containing protein [Pectobacterium odoriferum]|uniref:ATP-binding cassette domain-containing protein n=1 Tax=Pectobacterium odoriferum TaxID=78398 RepID=UPI0013738FB8|nr:ATP-binding cassette domain-containing protein [Pectobacterium odoriferum]QHP80217.1 ATP-binding cassette domain-containing protein [Pectobacterium odoriferum]